MRKGFRSAGEWLNVIVVGSISLFFPLAIFLAIIGS
jgi:hypothetical protein